MKLGQVSCGACGGTAHVNEGKGGTLSIACQASDCKALTMVKNPSAVAKLRARLAASSSSSSSSSNSSPAAGELVDQLLGGKS